MLQGPSFSGYNQKADALQYLNEESKTSSSLSCFDVIKIVSRKGSANLRWTQIMLWGTSTTHSPMEASYMYVTKHQSHALFIKCVEYNTPRYVKESYQ